MLKKILFYLFVIFIFLVIYFISNPISKTITIDNENDLIELFKTSQNNIIVELASGDYELTPTHFIDSTCANCEEPKTTNPATYGLKISGENIKIIGPKDRSAVIHTNSGYGLYIVDCQDFYLENITITDGIRDSAGMAGDAAIVVKNSSAKIHNNLITNNLGDSLMIVKNISGIMGICGRENSYLEITDNDIIRNSWDGIALFRNTEAIVTGNYIDGMDKAGGRTPKGGRGVAVGVTWNAKAKISNNYIARYWKGIGLFVDAIGIVDNNIIEDMNTWGISLWDASRGKPQGFISHNIVYDTGAMGAAITSSTEENPGFFKDNIIVQTAQSKAYDSPDYYGYQCPFALHLVPDDFVIENNLFFNNRRATEDLDDFDVDEEIFNVKLQEKMEWMKRMKFIGKSEFGKKFFNH
ncbi:MAG: right-handed parallel beta-helix repeat-containing protein [Candidatus Cloacimonetes bacterium]|nr:right-handed parallel beta-helix repeat-containing protein [Candidatus Cloacimonadota bacterium]MCF7813491.1 right-handed parallel beta-helix repeat-containing protein [Candidatus Cloacimonadota bacterium]MCF7868586.1 right-handed parallel beta-helix repeat-containing protein [Candidatus Cloacimonadota bacterium]MCF7883373.1 right-handed parallel beta-helix repeat-containing protein [Candidatus Cloacimonadota bacterium]